MKSRLVIGFLLLIFLVSCTPIAPTPSNSSQVRTATPTPQIQGDSLMVTSPSNGGLRSLRNALSRAKEGDIITFDPQVFPPNSPVTIQISGEELPAINVNYLTLDASNAGVILDGSQIEGDWVAGLQIVSSEGCKIMGLQISNFPGPGIAISGESKNNIIGGDRSIGDGPWGQGNLLTNNFYGISIDTSGATLNTVFGNLIGFDLQDSYWLGNQGFGIQIGERATGNTIGPDNIIAYNGNFGIYIDPPIRDANTVIDNQVFRNAIGIGWPIPPTIFDFDLAAGTVLGAACPECTIEIYSASGWGQNEISGGIFEGVTTADENGVFEYDHEAPLTGPFLTSKTIDLRGRTSRYYSYPLTSETEASLVLQTGNPLPMRQFLHEYPVALADNHLAGQYDGISYSEDRSDLTYIYSAGFTRARVSLTGIEPELVDWSKPEFSISPEQDQHFFRLADNEIAVTYVLMFWDKENYPNGQGAPCARFQTEEEIERWLDYVRFTIDELGEYVDYWEIWNEPDVEGYCPKWIELADYINLIQQTVPVIRELDPDGKIMVGAISYTVYDGAQEYLFGMLESEIMPMVDAISWHPMYGTSPKYDEYAEYYDDYPAFAQRIIDTAVENGFSGEFHVHEVGWSLNPGGGQFGEFSLLETNKYVLRSVMLHRGLGIDIGLGGEYYTIRGITTLMAGVEPAALPLEIESVDDNIMSYTFSTLEHERLIAVWTNGIAVDHDPGTQAAITIPDFSADNVSIIDLLNNLEQELVFDLVDGDLVIKNLLVRDYPLVIRLSGGAP